MEIKTQIDINASPDRVWAVLTDFAQYAFWNPFIRDIHGQIRANERLQVTLESSDGKQTTFRPVVTGLDPTRLLLSWRGTLIARWLFTGEHTFRLELLAPGRTRFHQSEAFAGLLVPLLRKSLDTTTKRDFELMNEALMEEAERTGF